MAASSVPKVVIRDFLVPGHHDELLSVLSHHTRKAGNQLVLSISEACVAEWPLNVQDYEPPAENLVEKQSFKITIREDIHPRLYKLFKTLRLGRKDMIFINMFNRHQLLKQTDPERVSAAIASMHAQMIGSPVSASEPHQAPEVGASQVQPTVKAAGGTEGERVDEELRSNTLSAEGQPISLHPDLEPKTMHEDPLAGLSISFDD